MLGSFLRLIFGEGGDAAIFFFQLIFGEGSGATIFLFANYP